MRRRLFFAIPLVIAPQVFGTAQPVPAQRKQEYESALRKVEQIMSDKLKPGTRVDLTWSEMKAFVAEQAKLAFPDGVRQPDVWFGTDVATGSALIDFGKVRRAQGKPPGWFMSKLLDGEREVKVTAHLRSGGGRAQVDLERVEISGVVVSGAMLDFLIQNYLLPNYPTAKVGRPFELGHHIDHVQVRPAAVTVLIGR